MPRGRKPKPVHLRVLEGNRGHWRIPAVPQPTISPEVPELPDFEGLARQPTYIFFSVPSSCPLRLSSRLRSAR